MVVIAIFVLIALAIFVKLKMPTWKGRFSERLVNDKLLQLPDEYVLFYNLLFESNGRSTQIDHIVVSPYGVFVIETKGYKGWILGGEDSEYWTQVIFKSKHQLYNPIKQNESHVRFLRHLLKCDVDIPFIPIVVFNNDADIKVNVVHHIVVNRCQLKKVIFQYKEAVLQEDAIKWITKTINEHSTITDRDSLKQHKNNVRNRQHRAKELINHGVCPHCGGNLVLRKGKYGKFYGCSNYPKCKFTVS